MTFRPVPHPLSPYRRAPRRGQALVEFGIIAFVFTLLIAGILTFGLLLHGANVIQQAADVGAMELARHPFSPEGTFDELLQDANVQDQLYSEKFLVCLIGGPNSAAEDLPANYTPADVANLQARMPLINRLLYPVYIYDRELNAIRYPGAVVTNDTTSEETVRVPLVTGRDSDGVETSIEWRPVLEEIRSNDVGPYPINADDPINAAFMPGMVALRINYPYQSASMIAWQYRDRETDTPLEVDDVLGADVDVNNYAVTASDANIGNPPGYTLLVVSDSGLGPNAGRAGLGRAYAMGKVVRPFRRVLSAQGIYRREVFAP